MPLVHPSGSAALHFVIFFAFASPSLIRRPPIVSKAAKKKKKNKEFYIVYLFFFAALEPRAPYCLAGLRAGAPAPYLIICRRFALAIIRWLV